MTEVEINIDRILRERFVQSYVLLHALVDVAIRNGVDLNETKLKEHLVTDRDAVIKKITNKNGQPHNAYDGIVDLYHIDQMLWKLGETTPKVPDEFYRWPEYVVDNLKKSFTVRHGASINQLEVIEAVLGLQQGPLGDETFDTDNEQVIELLTQADKHTQHISTRYLNYANLAASKAKMALDLSQEPGECNDASLVALHGKMREYFAKQMQTRNWPKTADYLSVVARVLRLMELRDDSN